MKAETTYEELKRRWKEEYEREMKALDVWFEKKVCEKYIDMCLKGYEALKRAGKEACLDEIYEKYRKDLDELHEEYLRRKNDIDDRYIVMNMNNHK